MSDGERTKLGPDLQVMVSRAELLSTATRIILRHRDDNDDVLVNLFLLPSDSKTDHAPLRFATDSMYLSDSLDADDVFAKLVGFPYLDEGFARTIEDVRQEGDAPEAEIVFMNQGETDNLVGTMSVYLKME